MPPKRKGLIDRLAEARARRRPDAPKRDYSAAAAAAIVAAKAWDEHTRKTMNLFHKLPAHMRKLVLDLLEGTKVRSELSREVAFKKRVERYRNARR